MAGLTHMYDIYKRDPRYVESLLKSEIEVEEKLAGSRFYLEVHEGNQKKYFKGSNASPITQIDRALSRYYEKAIGHFESFNDEKLANVPDNWRFGFEYFPNLQPVSIAYARMPLNNLVLIEIAVKSNNKVSEVISDDKTLNEWADILEVEGPPIIFKGQLNSEQLRTIQSYLNTPEDELEEHFSTKNFAKFFIETLSPRLDKSFLQNTLDDEIEALIFKFDGKNPMKVMNPTFEKKKLEVKDAKPSDMYSLTLVILQEFFLELDFNTIKLK